ncbi:MAG: pyridoxamine 5'-phosphate oxidase [Saprospiraceae bacterium]
MSITVELAQLRQEYSKHELDENVIHVNPLEQFKLWISEALNAQVIEPNAFILSTIGEDGFPAARVMLLKEVDTSGFVFYTNYTSSKGKDIQNNPVGSMTFLWLELQRQVRIKGRFEKVSRQQSLEYFQSRPFDSQIGAWVSPQSSVIQNRAVLDQEFEQLKKKYKGEDKLPLPDHWGGYKLIPVEVEFWQGRMGRLHDRIRYHNVGEGVWTKQRLAP